MKPENDQIKMVIVVRKDLNMRKGKMCAQVGHSVMGFLLDNNESDRNDCLNITLSEQEMIWLEEGQAKIVVSCDSEDELEGLMFKAKMRNIQTHKIIDHGRTEFHGVPTLTCCAFGPDFASKLDQITSHLKLL
jgi:peptidyl-tRNA hydrolase, PTH2 family